MLAFAAPRARRADFAELLEAYAATGVVVETHDYSAAAAPDARELVERGSAPDALLLVGQPRRSPRTSVEGPVVRDASGRAIAVGWLPCVDSFSHRRFASAAARVRSRAQSKRSLALLSQWHPRYLKLAERVEHTLDDSVCAFRWTGERIGREALVGAMGSGLGVALYLGHGRPSGWVGYWGLRARHFDDFRGEPFGAVLSLCCLTASRRRVGLSYSEALTLRGVAAASLGAVTRTLHTDNTRWVVRLCETLAQPGVRTLADLVVRALGEDPRACVPYRIVGDPLAPLRAPASSLRRAAAVETHP